MTKKEEAWVNTVIAALMARPPVSNGWADALDTSDVAQDAEAIRADERERIAALLERFVSDQIDPKYIASWLREGAR